MLSNEKMFILQYINSVFTKHLPSNHESDINVEGIPADSLQEKNQEKWGRV